jgi:hypothetical protein
VSVKESITDESRINIRFMTILEPRSLPEYGGGCGDSYLVVGSVSVIRVYSLVKMKLLWSYSTRYINAIAVAKDENEIFLPKNASRPVGSTKIEQEGWIAIATSTMKMTSDEVFGKESAGRGSEENNKKKNKNNKDKSKNDHQENKKEHSTKQIQNQVMNKTVFCIVFCMK